MRDGGFYADDFQSFRINALAAPLAKIEGGGGTTGDQYRQITVCHHRTRSHLDVAPCQGGKMALFILQLELSVAEPLERDLQFDRSGIQS